MRNRIRGGVLALGLGLLVVQAGAQSATGAAATAGTVAIPDDVETRAQAWTQQWGPPVGTRAPAISAPDQHGATRSLDALGRANGLLIIFNRSADW